MLINRELNLNKLLIFIGLLFLTHLNLVAKENNYLKNTSLVSNQLKLTFGHKIKRVKYFTIKKNGIIKHVYDIKGGFISSGKTIKNLKAEGVKSIRIGQFNKSVLRIVIESKYFLAKRHRLKNRRVTIYLPAYKKVLQKSHKQKTHKKEVRKKGAKKKRVYTKKSHQKYHYSKKRHQKLVILDAGHGGRDIGASNRNIIEKNLTLSMTLKLRDVLKKMGYKVRMTRSTDKTMRLKERTDYANKYGGNIFISLHVNAAPKKRTPNVRYEGITVFYLSTKNIKKRLRKRRTHYKSKKRYSEKASQQMISAWKSKHSKSLAIKVRKNILKGLRKHYTVNDKGIKRQGFWVLLATTMPSILVETGYISHKRDLKRLQNSNYQRRLVEGIAKGVNSYFGL